MNQEKIRVVVTNPETRDAVTYQFNDLKEVMAWARKEMNSQKSAGVRTGEASA